MQRLELVTLLVSRAHVADSEAGPHLEGEMPT